MRIYRVVVRGQFDEIDPSAKARLLDEVADHDYLRSAFTAAGTFTYDEKLIAFNFRYEVREADDDVDEATIGDAAIDRTVATLEAMKIRAKHLRATVTDMASVWD